MALEYFCCFHSYRNKLAKLSDQEVGRLFRALLEYSETGEAPELTGRESVAFDFISYDIDRSKEAYKEKSEKNSDSAKKRYERKRSDANASERIRTHTNASERRETKTNTKTKTEYNNLTTTTARAREESAFAVDYFRNHLNPTAPEHDFREIAEYVTYFDRQGGDGNALVIKACQSAQSNRAFTWNYVRAILEKCKKTGIKTVSEFEAAERDRERQKGDGKNGRTGASSDAVSGNAQGFGTKL